VRQPFADRIAANDRGHAIVDLCRSLGRRYAQCTLSTYEIYDPKQKAVIDRLRYFAEEMPEFLETSGGLLLFGNPGTGKDHLIAALLKLAIAKHGLTVAWWDAGALFDELYFAIKADDEAPLKSTLKMLRRPHVLAISDPQPPQGSLSDAQLRRLRDLIDWRYRAGLSTWLTTNLDNREHAEKLLTAPVMQRVKEASGVILCDWPSYRERRKAKW